MPRAPSYPIWSQFAPAPGRGPLSDQLTRFVRHAVVGGALPPGTRLAASRSLAAEIGVARNTVVSAYDRLIAEGLLESRRGAGTFVSTGLRRPPAPHAVAGGGALARRAQSLMALAQPPPGRAADLLTPGLPDLSLFPTRIWARLSSRYWRGSPALGYADPGGIAALRGAIAGFIGATRGISCAPEQVLLTPGTQGALHAAALALTDPGDRAWIEHPGYAQTWRVLTLAGVKLVPVPVDAEGIDVAAGRAIAPDARLAVVSPSHQYPCGATLSLARRLALLAWAQQAGAWIIEDDYDGEYRYDGAPVQALKSLDRDARVVYVGTLSKLLAPGLRLGFMVVPEHLVDALSAVRGTIDLGISEPLQAVCADFIGDGHLAKHIRQTHGAYRVRRDALREALRRVDAVRRIDGTDAGLHLLARLDPAIDDTALTRAANAQGIGIRALSSYGLRGAPTPDGGLVIGYANTPATRIGAAIERVARLVPSARLSGPRST